MIVVEIKEKRILELTQEIKKLALELANKSGELAHLSHPRVEERDAEQVDAAK